MAKPPSQPAAGKRKKKRPAVYVAAQYPAWLGIVSFAWALAGWAIAAAAPHLAFFPLIGVLHYVLPAVTVGLIAANLYLAVRETWRGAHPLSLLLVTGLQIALFTTLFYQLFAHAGAELYDVEGPTYPWQWAVFSAAHALRASDVLDAIEAFGMKVQPIKHQSAFVAVFVIAYHVVIDVFVLGVLWALVARVKRGFLEDEVVFDFIRKALKVAFVVWLVTCVFVVTRWSLIDIPLWLVENVLRVIDFADVMESFNLRLHDLPREGLTGFLTTLCRFWIALGIALALGERKKAKERRIATPPDVSPFPYWARRVGFVAGVLLALVAAGLLGQAVLGNPTPRLTAAVSEGPEGRAFAALRALRRMGPSAQEAVPALVEARANVSPAVRDDVTRTLGYLGADAVEPLTGIALREEGPAAALAAEGLSQVGPESAPALAKVWVAAADESVRQRAGDELRRLGSPAVPHLMEATTRENAEAHYRWFEELDRNWRLRAPKNNVAQSLQQMPDLLRRLNSNPDAAAKASTLAALRWCGSAAREAMPAVLPLLRDTDASVRGEAVSLVREMGSRATPELLGRLAESESRQDAVRQALCDHRMWDAAALKHERALPFLVSLLGPGSDRASQAVAVRALGLAGAKAKHAVPALVARLGETDESIREEVRQSLARIDPDWKKHPQIHWAIPALLPRLTALPRGEADELFAALGELQPDQAEAVRRLLRDVPVKSARGMDKETVEKLNREYLDPILDALDRLGPRAKAAVRPLYEALGQRKEEPATRRRIALCLKRLGADMKFVLPALHGPEAAEFLGELDQAEALSCLESMLDAEESSARWFAVAQLAGYGPAAKPLVPKVIELLKKGTERVSRNDNTPAHKILLRTLNAIDKDWARDPAAAKAFSAIVANFRKQGEEARHESLRMLVAFGPAAKPAVADLVGLMLEKYALFDDKVVKALDQIDPRWREHPSVKTVLPDLVKRLDEQIFEPRALLALGDVAIPELEKALESGKAWRERAALMVLGRMGPAAKKAVPGIAKRLADPMRSWESLIAVLTALRTIDPEWGTRMDVKESVEGLVAEVMKRGKLADESSLICCTVGAPAVPALKKYLTGAGLEQRKIALVSLGGIGPAAKDALADVQKAVKDRDVAIRRVAVPVVGQIGKGNKDLVAVLVPALIDPDNYVRFYAPRALDAVDPDWKKSPKFEPVRKQILQALTSKDYLVRWSGVDALANVGPVEGAVAALEKLAKVEDNDGTKKRIQEVLDKFRSGK